VLLTINLAEGPSDLFVVVTTTCHILDEIILGLIAEPQGLLEDLSYLNQIVLGWLEWQDVVITFHFDKMYPFVYTVKFLLGIIG
jgi:hypothetical protein